MRTWSRKTQRCLVGIALLCAVAALVCTLLQGADFWLTPDQRGDRLMRREEFSEAAKRYGDPFRAGTALYLAGQFEEADAMFARLKTPEADFNRGNALVMLGKYEDAVQAYDGALAQRPNWQAAQANREIARTRAERLEKEGGDMTGGMLAADEFVFSPKKGDNNDDQREAAQGTQVLADSALQAMWLRRVQTKPGDFLRAKFAYQTQQGGSE